MRSCIEKKYHGPKIDFSDLPESCQSLRKEYYKETCRHTEKNLIKSGYALKLKALGNREIIILDLGCGHGTGFLALYYYFFKRYSLSFRYIGVDINKEYILENKIFFAAFKNAEFYCRDASVPANLADILQEKSVDLAFCQHPEIMGDQAVPVSRMLNKTMPHYLADHGYIYISTYYEMELKIVLALRYIDFKLPWDKKNQFLYFTNEPQKNREYPPGYEGQPQVHEHFVYMTQVPRKECEKWVIAKPVSESRCSQFGFFSKACIITAGLATAATMLINSINRPSQG